MTPDDHEVANDYAGVHPEGSEPSPEFAARRAAAYQALYEHLPLRASSLPRNGAMRLHRRVGWGDLAELNVLDTRQYRSNQMCGDGEFPRCAESLGPSVTMLGREQEDWLLDGLSRSHSRWNVIAQQVMMGSSTTTAASRGSTGTTRGTAIRSRASGSSTTSRGTRCGIRS